VVEETSAPLVVMLKLVLVAPAGTVTLGGTVAKVVLLLASVTTAPPAGAALVRVTVPCDVLPPVTLVGLSVSVESVGLLTGETVSVAVLVSLRVAKIVMVFAVASDCVVTVNVVLLAPAGIVTRDGAEATAGSLLANVTTAPPGGAAQPGVRATVPCDVPPPVTAVGFKVKV
jgi:hypothetical protein